MGCPGSTLRAKRKQSICKATASVLLTCETQTALKSSVSALRDGEPGAAEEQLLLNHRLTSDPDERQDCADTKEAEETMNATYASKEEALEVDSDAELEDTAEIEETIKQTLSTFDVVMRNKRVLKLKGIQGMIFRALDTGLDFRTAVRFYMEGEVRWAVLTLTFTFVSPMIQCFFVHVTTKKCKLALPFLIPGSVQHLRREWRQLQLVRELPQAALFQNIHSQAGANYFNEVLAGIECLFESLPQACIQGYSYQVDGNADLFNYISLSFSIIGVLLGVVFGLRAMLKSAVGRKRQRNSTLDDATIDQWNDASAAGDTLAMHSVLLSNSMVQALASFVRADDLITVCDLSQTNCTDKQLCTLTGACKRMTKANLSGCRQITDEGVTKLAENCKDIKEVHLVGCRQITDAGVTKLAENCKDIHVVDLSGCDKITDEGVTKLAENCKDIKEVHLSGCRQITDAGVTKLAENCKDIHMVNLGGCDEITDEGVAKLTENCKDIKEVHLDFCRQITDEGVTKLAENCKDIHLVNLDCCDKITDEGVTKLAENCKDIHVVDLSGCDKITDEGVTKLAENCKDIHMVNLGGCDKITDEGVTKLAENCKDIKEVHLSGCRQITDAGVTKLAENCKDIHMVNLGGCDEITDEGVAKLTENCKDIKEVHLVGCNKITDECVTKLKERFRSLL